MWVYAAAIPFHKFNMPKFDIACKAIGRYGRRFKGLGEYQLWLPLRKQTYAKVNKEFKKQKESWYQYGCNMLIYGWTNQMCCSVMNLCMHSKSGTSFVNLVEDSVSAHMGEYIFGWLEDCIKQIGECRVLQVIIKNAVTNMATKNIMVTLRPTLFRSSCASLTIDLILEDIEEFFKYKTNR